MFNFNFKQVVNEKENFKESKIKSFKILLSVFFHLLFFNKEKNKNSNSENLDNSEELLKSNSLLNFITEDLEIKMAENKGRGVFTTRNIKSGELLIIEKALAHSENNDAKIVGMSFSEKKYLYDITKTAIAS